MRTLTALAAITLFSATSALAQMGPPPGGGGGPGGRGGPPGDGHMKEMKPVKRDKIDKPVTAMFRTADANKDGIVTNDELRAIIDARRDTLIHSRFEKVDSNHDGTISQAEFTGWQKQMGSASLSDAQPMLANSLIPATLEPELGDDPEDRVLGQVIEPLSATVIVNANANYDAGISLDELLSYERARFDKLDADGNGELSMDELRALHGPGDGPGNRPRPGDGPPPHLQ